MLSKFIIFQRKHFNLILAFSDTRMPYYYIEYLNSDGVFKR